MKTVLVTGGAGFIGGCYIRMMARSEGVRLVNLDKLTYAGNLDSLATVDPSVHTFVRGDIGDHELLAALLETHRPSAIIHFAAESHVDRSIDDPVAFVRTNAVGTTVLLEATRRYLRSRPSDEIDQFRFLHVSTDEVFGSLGPTGFFTESSPYSPRSPYAASKAAADHVVRAYRETYGLPVLITNCSNNYGPFQFPEKLIPLMTLNAIEGKPLPVYGDGMNVRDWLFVEDHCEAIQTVLTRGRVGETYNIGGNCQQSNRDIVRTICQIVQELLPSLPYRCEELITYVVDRPGHDRRYAIDATKIQQELGWTPKTLFMDGMRRTIQWYIDHPNWVARIRSGTYRGERLGLP